jgi:photosynthetic reaction center cytochrome c subunit
MHQRLFGMIIAATAAIGLARGQAAESKTAEQVYQNITQLKGIPADQLGPAMQFIASSLGVECTFCHVQGKMELDDKPAKKTARSMMAMTAAINKDSFGGRTQVTCYSCHRGSTRPVNMPAVLESDAAPRPAAPAAPAGGTAATADEIAGKYVTAIGGADAIRKVTSRVMKGTILAGGSETPIELITKAPNMRISITHMGAHGGGSGSDSITAFDGTVGWLGSTGRAAREMSAAESGAAGLDAEFYLALRLKELFPQLRRGRPEEVAGVECEVLNGTGPGHPPVRLYFDKKSGLLVRMVRYAETPMGRMPTQIDYADYRETDGVKTPFRLTLSRPNGRFTIQIAELKNNAPLDDAKFAKPTGDVK